MHRLLKFTQRETRPIISGDVKGTRWAKRERVAIPSRRESKRFLSKPTKPPCACLLAPDTQAYSYVHVLHDVQTRPLHKRDTRRRFETTCSVTVVFCSTEQTLYMCRKTPGAVDRSYTLLSRRREAKWEDAYSDASSVLPSSLKR